MPRIAYLGPEHTNTHMAALKRFGRRARYLHAPTVEDVFRLVEREQADYGVVPIENSLEGAVTYTLDRFIDFRQSPVKIHGEIEQRICHYAILRKGTKLSQIRLVFSHPQALAQCQIWLDQYMRRATRAETNSTAEAVESLVDESAAYDDEGKLVVLDERAAIGRAELAAKYKLRAIPIPEQRENKTRFLIIGLGTPEQGRRNKTSILFSLKDRPGALYDALTPFKRERINLTKIESRPSKQKAWEYYFFIDVEGHESELRVKRALHALERSTLLLRILGSYPVSKR